MLGTSLAFVLLLLMLAMSSLSDCDCRYVRRRAKEGFREAQTVTDAVGLEQLWQQGRELLEVAQRQAQVYKLYARSTPSIMDLELQQRR